MNKFLNKRIRSNKKGFTIVETLVAVLILAFVITGPMVFTSQSIKTAYYARDQVVAFYMTQEIIELIKNARDNKALSALSSGNCEASQTFPTRWLACDVDLLLEPCIAYSDSEIRYCTIGLRPNLVPFAQGCTQGINSCPFISINKNPASIPIYAYPTTPSANWDTTTYKRIVSIIPVPGKGHREVEIIVSVFWNTGFSTREFTVRQNITNWLPLSNIFE